MNRLLLINIIKHHPIKHSSLPLSTPSTPLLSRIPKTNSTSTTIVRMSSSKTPPPKTTKSASCLCNQIQFSVTGVDRGAVLCHCVNCQKGSGSAFAHNHQMTNASVEYASGKDLVKTFADKETKSGNTLSRSFCSNCGGNLFVATSQTPDLVVINAGALQGPKTPPKREFFKDNKESWLGEVTAAAKM